MREELGNELYARRTGIMDGISKTLRGGLEVGRNLLAIKKGKLHMADGNHVSSFWQWVENELGISRAEAKKKMDAADKWGDVLENSVFTAISDEKLILLSRLITSKTTDSEKKDLLHMAQEQTMRGLRDNIRERQGKVATDVCSHKEENQEAWNKCKDCGKFWR